MIIIRNATLLVDRNIYSLVLLCLCTTIQIRKSSTALIYVNCPNVRKQLISFGLCILNKYSKLYVDDGKKIRFYYWNSFKKIEQRDLDPTP